MCNTCITANFSLLRPRRFYIEHRVVTPDSRRSTSCLRSGRYVWRAIMRICARSTGKWPSFSNMEASLFFVCDVFHWKPIRYSRSTAIDAISIRRQAGLASHNENLCMCNKFTTDLSSNIQTSLFFECDVLKLNTEKQPKLTASHVVSLVMQVCQVKHNEN